MSNKNNFLERMLLCEGTSFQKLGRKAAYVYSPIAWGITDELANSMGGYFNSFLIAGVHGFARHYESKEKLSVGKEIVIPISAVYASYLIGRVSVRLLKQLGN